MAHLDFLLRAERGVAVELALAMETPEGRPPAAPLPPPPPPPAAERLLSDELLDSDDDI